MSSLGVAGRTLLILALAGAAFLGTVAPVAADESGSRTELQKIVDIAKSELGAKWSFAATGPSSFDCSGFVTYVFRQAGLLDRIGGKRRTVAGYFKWFNHQNPDRATKSDALPGDLIVWGRNKHIGIYLGDGMAISALVNPYGVKVHPVVGYLRHMPVKAFLHVHLER
jgi:cell wall-associated NlpC family hydrolase